MENKINLIGPQKNNPFPARYSNSRQKWFIAVWWLICIALGAWQAWDARHQMNADGISYLDIGDAYFRGDWGMAINAHWSPLYSWMVGSALHFLQPSSYNEFPVVQLVNFVIYLLTLGCFHFFLMQLIRYHQFLQAQTPSSNGINFPEWAWIALGYSLFLYASLNMIVISTVTPDMCVEAFVFLACGILLRMRRKLINYREFVLLGLVLGFGYLAKAAMFPLAFVFLILSVFSIDSFRKAAPRAIIALIVFLSVASPFIIAISHVRGRFTFGDAGKYNYWVHVNHNNPTHWNGNPPGSGAPKHPPRQIFNTPRIFEFGTPIGGTYPLWYDPTYWHEGIKTTFNLKQQLQAVIKVSKMYYEIFYYEYRVLIFGSIMLYLMGRRQRSFLKAAAEHRNLFIPAVAAFGMYSLVAVDYRYVAPFIVLFWLGIFSTIRLPAHNESERLLRYAAIVMVLVTLISSIRHVGDYGNDPEQTQWRVADFLAQIGISPGDKVSSIGNSHNHFWARLAKVRIVAEIPNEDASVFWKADSETQANVIETLGKTGAKVIVTNLMPNGIPHVGWQQIVNSNYYVYKISPVRTVAGSSLLLLN